jgi:hypothetical protein
MATKHKAIFLITALQTLGSAAQGMEPVPVRPGLWEVTVSGPSIAERIKNTPPDRRQSMEQVAGISIKGETMVRRVCITPEMLAKGVSTKNRPDCDFKQEWKGKITKITFQCPNGSTGKGELNYVNKESYKGWMDSERSAGAQTAPQTVSKKSRNQPTKKRRFEFCNLGSGWRKIAQQRTTRATLAAQC